MSTIKFNSEGYPTAGFIKGSMFVMSASGVHSAATKPKIKPDEVEPNIYEQMNALRWVPWGASNNYPAEMLKDFRMNGVASRGLEKKASMLYGKRVVPCIVKGYEPDGQTEILEICEDPEVLDFLKRSNINELRNRLINDFVWFGMAFPTFYLTDDRSKISMVVHDKAAKHRFAKFDDKLGRIDTVYRSANWPLPSAAQVQEIKCIDNYMYYLEVDRVRYEKSTRYVCPIKSYDLLNDYYVEVIHESIRKNGTLSNSNDIPAIVKGMIKNVASIKYHIRIPMSYWTQQYPDFMRKTDAEREAIVSIKLQEINDFLTGKDNQMKAFVSHYATDEQTGKEIAGWEIIELKNDGKYDVWNGVDTMTAANILFSIGINPAIFGLGSPGGAHTGGSNNGGSNIREAWLVMIASSQGERDILYSWWNFVREYNGYPDNVELRTIDQVLTTLDQGKGTVKQLS